MREQKEQDSRRHSLANATPFRTAPTNELCSETPIQTTEQEAQDIYLGPVREFVIEQSHPLPWRVQMEENGVWHMTPIGAYAYSSGMPLFGYSAEALARFIVHRVNCHNELLRLAKEATNGWACYASRKAEHDEIARLHSAIVMVEGK